MNSPVTGNWEGFMIQEPGTVHRCRISRPFPTGIHEASPESLLEDMELSAPGCGIRMSLALCVQCTPVGTETGVSVSASLPKWDILVNTKSMD